MYSNTIGSKVKLVDSSNNNAKQKQAMRVSPIYFLLAQKSHQELQLFPGHYLCTFISYRF